MKVKLLFLLLFILAGIGIYTLPSLHIDDDSLSVGQELKYGTLVVDADSDGDGFTDGLEVESSPKLTNETHPLQKDVFVEVDSVAGASLSSAEKQRLKQVFASAPVNSIGETSGIQLHIIQDETNISTEEPVSFSDYQSEIYPKHFDKLGYGYHHALIVEDIAKDDALGVASPSLHGFIVEDKPNNRTGRIFMHELGHSLGLTPDVYNGIDQPSDPAEYPSVMNYAYPSCKSDCDTLDSYSYSSGPGFNDWKYLEESMNHPPITRLETNS